MLKTVDYNLGAEAPSFRTDGWRYLYGSPSCRGVIRENPEDFQVDEELGFEPTGEGPHGWCYLRYTGRNTLDMVRLIASACDVPIRDIGFSGLKDRNAITAQWFSIPRGKGREDPSQCLERLCGEQDGITLLRSSANARKLKRGVHRANGFRIIVRGLMGECGDLEHRLVSIRDSGVPNYFGPQRFGRHDSNLDNAVMLFTRQRAPKGRQARSMALSAARSWLFNQVLSERLGAYSWDEALDGDRMMLAGSRSHFLNDGRDDTVVDRIRRGDIHLSGPMWGVGEALVNGDAADFEQRIINAVPILPEGLIAAGLKQERRALRLLPDSMSWNLQQSDELEISFTLPAGSFATAVLRELVDLP